MISVTSMIQIIHFNIIPKKTLSTVLLNNCAHVTTKGILAFLNNLKLLERIEANNGQNSSVQQSIAILENEYLEYLKLKHNKEETQAPKLISFPNMKDFVFRNPRAGLATVARFCPSLIKVYISQIRG